MSIFRMMASVCLTVVAQMGLFGGTICSTVIDPGGLPLPNASTKILGLLSAPVRFSGLTDQSGKVCLTAVPEGLYAVEISLTGFLNVRYYPVRLLARNTANLTFTLPFGYIGEGGVVPESLVSGSLRRVDIAVSGVKICLFASDRSIPEACDITDDLGEYAISVAPGVYWVEISERGKQIQPRRRLDLSTPGRYRNRIGLEASQH